MIPVTKPFLPNREKVIEYLDGIWNRNWFTNNGPLLNEFEIRLKEELKVNHLLVTNNGTSALQLAIKALNLTGEVITTPFSYVATTSSIAWEGCKPVFVDIDSETFNIDTSKIEEAITNSTSGIIATHCFGNPCDIDSIQEIAQRYNLKVIYDAAHCFGTLYKGKSVLEFGDVSTLSLHSTKLIHSVEGGALVTRFPKILRKMAFMRNFGHDGPEGFAEVGINAKNSELHAAVGLAVIKQAKEILNSRKAQKEYYDNILAGLRVYIQKETEHSLPNYSYYPVVFETEADMLNALDQLNRNEIYPRRYFYPLLSSLNYVESSADLNVAKSVSARILCLPMFYDLSQEEQDFIARILLRSQRFSSATNNLK